MKDEADQIQMMRRSLDGPKVAVEASRTSGRQRGTERTPRGPMISPSGPLRISTCADAGPGGATFAAAKDPIVDAAVRLWDNEAISEQLQVLTIADCPRDEIASRLHLDERVIAVAEQLFFDVRWSLKASGWTSCHVIVPMIRAGTVDLASKLKLAYFGGPVIARAILEARVRVPGEEAARLFGREVLLQLKAQEALEAPLGEGERIEFLKLYLQYDVERQRLDLEPRESSPISANRTKVVMT